MSDPVAASIYAGAEQALEAMLDRAFAQLKPRPKLTALEWVERYRILSKEESPDFGGKKFDVDNIPVMRGPLSMIGQKGISRIVGQKSAQHAWTSGVVCTALAYHTHWRPSVTVTMFPRAQSAKDFDAEKFSPMVSATPVLYRLIDIKSRSKGNSQTRKHFPGGLHKFVASNSPSDVKSTSARVRVVEEPDDTSKDVRGQGKSIALLRERGKTIRGNLEIIGGTPTAKGASEIEAEMRTTDQRRFMCVCHACGERHDLSWDHVTIPGFVLSDEDLNSPDIDARFPLREVYGRARWEDAYYACPHCGAIWTDDERITNIRRSASGEFPNFGWEPTAESPDPGFFMNELQSCFDGSRIPELAKKFLRAVDLQNRGDQSEIIAFWNSSRGLPWEYRGELPEEDELRARAEDYAEWSCPAGGLVPKLTVDVQHDRLAVSCWVTGRADERWLAYWGEIHGQTIVPLQGAWVELARMLDQKIAHASGAQLNIEAVAIDCSDGQTSDAVYAFQRRYNRTGRPVYAVKGAPDAVGRIEIWSPPKKIDPNHRATKAAKWGVEVHIVGTAKAKDLILGWSEQGGQIRLHGNGPGRMHWYKTVRADAYEQLLSEIKVPARHNPRIREWKERTDRRNELLDCTVYDTWLSRKMRLHLRRPAEWDVIEMRIKQAALFDGADLVSSPVDAPEDAAPAIQQHQSMQTSAPAPEPIPTAPRAIAAPMRAPRASTPAMPRKNFVTGS